jgi:hypothetical protein
VANPDVRPRDLVLPVPRDAKRPMLFTSVNQEQMVSAGPDWIVYHLFRPLNVSLDRACSWIPLGLWLHQVFGDISQFAEGLGGEMAI